MHCVYIWYSNGHGAGYLKPKSVPNRGTVKPPEKPPELDQRTAGRSEPVPRNCPEIENRTVTVHPAQRFLGTETGTRPNGSLEPVKKLAVGDFLYKYSTLSIIFICNSSLLLLSLLNYAIILLIT